jgi:hypothetical protein
MAEHDRALDFKSTLRPPIPDRRRIGHGPSREAVGAGAIALQRTWPGPLAEKGRVSCGARADSATVLVAAHDPALGLDRSVCLRDVLNEVWNATGREGLSKAARQNVDALVERAFTGPSSPEGEGT